MWSSLINVENASSNQPSIEVQYVHVMSNITKDMVVSYNITNIKSLRVCVKIMYK